MTPERRLRAALELALFRLLAPRWFAREPLDALLSRRGRQSSRPRPGELAALVRDVPRVEAWLARARIAPASCLYRALARYALLCRRGQRASFVLGIDAAGLDRPGHAWVEVDGAPFAESEDLSSYRVTFRYPSSKNGGSLEA